MQDTHEQHINDFEVWEYPTFNGGLDHDLMMDSDLVSDLVEETTSDLETIEQDADTTLVDNTTLEIIHDQAIVDDKINYLDTMGSQMADTLSNVDAGLLQSLIALVRQSVKKIIIKELSLDEHAIKRMIEQSLEKINKDKVPCVIHVSEEDYPVFENKSYLDYVQIIIDHELTQGSFIIKTKFSKLHAILEDRLNVLFGL